MMMAFNTTYKINNEGIRNIDEFVDKYKDFLIDILMNNNIQYCKASLLYRFLIFSNISFTDEYIIEKGGEILQMLLEVFYEQNNKQDRYDDKNIVGIFRKDDETLKKMHSIHYVLNNP